MYSTNDAIDWVYAKLKNKSLVGSITGKVYKYTRPGKSTKEDVVINALPISNESVQECTVNVNIYVADTSMTLNGEPFNAPDHVRITTLSGLVLNNLQELHESNKSVFVEFQTVIAEPEIRQHYINVRLKVLFHKS